MTEQQIRAVVEQVLARLGQDAPPVSTDAPSAPGDPLPDISAIDLRRQYLVESPHDQAAFLAMKERTPARIGVGRAGARYRTETMLRFQADHAAAQDAVFSDINDAEGLERDLEMTRTLGFDGKTCVHPRQIDQVNACFTPSAKEIRNARRVLEALEEAARNHTGVCVLDGGMVDKPMELRARTTLAKAEAAGIKWGGEEK